MLTSTIAKLGTRRQGYALVMAMLLLVMGSALAVGLFATVTSSIKIASNDLSSAKAMAAAQSGIGYLNRRVSHLTMTGGLNVDDGNAILDDLCTKLNADTSLMANTGGQLVTQPKLASGDHMLQVPKIRAQADNSWFEAIIDGSDIQTNGLTLKVIGHTTGTGDNAFSRAVSVDLNYSPGTPAAAPFFSATMTCYGKMSLGGNGAITAMPSKSTGKKSLTIMAAGSGMPPFTLSGSMTIGSSDYPTVLKMPSPITTDRAYQTLMGSTDSVSIGGMARHWNTPLQDFYTGGKFVTETPPPKPQFDPSTYAQGTTPVSSTIRSGWTNWRDTEIVLTNASIPAASGSPPSEIGIAQPVRIRGTLYIEYPNRIQFRRPVIVEDGGCIVFARKPNGSVPNTSGTTESYINFVNYSSSIGSNNVTSPAKGYSILAPDALVNFSQGPTSVTFKGSIIANKIWVSGNSQFTIDGGTMLALSEATDAFSANGGPFNLQVRTPEADEIPTGGIAGGSASNAAMTVNVAYYREW